MKGFIKKLGFTTALMVILGITLNAQIAHFQTDPGTLCEGSVTKFVSTSTPITGIDKYVWTFSDGSDTLYGMEVEHQFAQASTYLVKLEIYIGAIIKEFEAPVTIHPTPIADFVATSACIGTWTRFDNKTNLVGEAVYEYDWSFGDGETDESVEPNHFYPYAKVYTVTLSVETDYGCVDEVTKDVKVYKNPIPNIGVEDFDLCVGESVNLSESNYAMGILWDAAGTINKPQSHNITIKELPLGRNVIEATIYETHNEWLSHGFKPVICDSSSQVEITVHANPTITLSSSPESVVPGSRVNLYASSEDLIDHWVWTSDYGYDFVLADSVNYTIDQTTEFFVEVTDIYDCKATGSIIVEVDLKPNNIITPNNDGKNDLWVASKTMLNEADGYELVIFNRWGEEVLNQKGYSNDWDGTSNGEELPEGTYYYVIKHNDNTYTGPITLLR